VIYGYQMSRASRAIVTNLYRVKGGKSTFLIALGGNLPSSVGVPTLTLRHVLGRIAAAGVMVSRVSRFYETPCFPAGAGPDYVNAAAELSADMTPHQMLDLLHRI
jgi:2-amino-4-hydroxy-6-hydroxymethyldihydropteridine diphosphokinase